MIFNSSTHNSHWQDKKLSDLGTFRRGKSKHRPRNDPVLFKDGVYPLVQTGEVKSANLYISSHNVQYSELGLQQSALWPENTLCITIAANIAETSVLSYPMCFPDSVVGFNANPEESSELFMHYVFTYIRKAIQSSVSGSIQDNININYLTDLKFKIPVKKYQDKIVTVLSNIDKKIELNNKINAELIAMTKLIYNYWFLQFDFPSANGKPYKSSGGKMVYNEVLKRMIPEGWRVKSLSDLSTKIGDGIHGTPTYVKESEFSFINGNNLKKGFIHVAGDTKKVDNSEYEKYLINLDENSILLSINGTLGNLAVYSDEKVMLGKSAAYINCLEGHRAFCYQYLSQSHMQKLFWNLATGSTIKNLSLGSLQNLKLAYPKDDLLDKFNLIVGPIDDKRLNIFKENKALIELREWLLPMLMNGQVTVKEV